MLALAMSKPVVKTLDGNDWDVEAPVIEPAVTLAAEVFVFKSTSELSHCINYEDKFITRMWN
jgi:hypothetical protein